MKMQASSGCLFLVNTKLNTCNKCQIVYSFMLLSAQKQQWENSFNIKPVYFAFSKGQKDMLFLYGLLFPISYL